MHPRLLIRLCFLLTVTQLVQAQVYVNQSIEADAKWTKDNSPYIIVENIVIEKDATLSIEAGTKVYFAAETQMIIDGTLRAIGKKRKKVLFTGQEGASWNGFLFMRSCGAYDPEKGEGQGTVFINCEFKGIGEAPAHLIRTKGCNLLVKNCTIENSYTAIQSERQAKVYVHDNSFENCNRPLNVRNTSMAWVTGNEMEGCNSIMLGGTTTFTNNSLSKFTGRGRHSGLIVWMLGGGIVTVENNEFLKFEDYAVKLQKMSRRSTFNLKNNKFKDNPTNLKLSCKYLNKGNTTIENNNFYNYKEYQVKLFSPCSDEEEAVLTLGPNYWGKMTAEELRAAIFDQSQDEQLNTKVEVGEPLMSKVK